MDSEWESKVSPSGFISQKDWDKVVSLRTGLPSDLSEPRKDYIHWIEPDSLFRLRRTNEKEVDRERISITSIESSNYFEE